MILKQGKKAKIEKVASINKLGQFNKINYFIVYCNEIKDGVFASYVEACKRFNELEK